ncbi:AAA family ATPase [Candidatus Roizmanbacteria bacterium]|nr:AAA family ATPase [Candidatus Roizmanbacteria bacterium]
MKKVLVIGTPGSGKTYVSHSLKEKDINAHDADDIPALGRWIDKKGATFSFKADADQQWLDRHDFIWDVTWLTQWLSEQTDDVFLFGIASNYLETLPLFDQTYCLRVDRNIIARRLRDPSRENEFGNNEDQLKNVLNWADQFYLECSSHNIIFIDATLSPDEIYKLL